MNNFLFRLGALSAASSIAVQAIGGHNPWDIDRKLIFSKAFELHLSSAIGMILCSNRKSKRALFSGILFLTGTIMFSGFAYYRCFKNERRFNYLMPPGGSSIILAWFLLALS